MRTIGRTIESRDSGLISRGAYNLDFTVFGRFNEHTPPIKENIREWVCIFLKKGATSFDVLLRRY